MDFRAQALQFPSHKMKDTTTATTNQRGSGTQGSSPNEWHRTRNQHDSRQRHRKCWDRTSNRHLTNIRMAERSTTSNRHSIDFTGWATSPECGFGRIYVIALPLRTLYGRSRADLGSQEHYTQDHMSLSSLASDGCLFLMERIIWPILLRSRRTILCAKVE